MTKGKNTGFQLGMVVHAEPVGNSKEMYGVFEGENEAGIEIKCLEVFQGKYVFGHVFLPIASYVLYEIPTARSPEETLTLAVAHGSSDTRDADRLLVSFDFGESWVRALYPHLSFQGKHYVAKEGRLHDDIFFLKIIRAPVADINDDDDTSDDHHENTSRGAAVRAIQSQSTLIELARDASLLGDVRQWAFHGVASEQERFNILRNADEKLIHVLSFSIRKVLKGFNSIERVRAFIDLPRWQFEIVAELFARGAREDASEAVKKVGVKLLRHRLQEDLQEVNRFILDVLLEQPMMDFEILSLARPGRGDDGWIAACIQRLLNLEHLEYILYDLVNLLDDPQLALRELATTDERVKKAVDKAVLKKESDEDARDDGRVSRNWS